MAAGDDHACCCPAVGQASFQDELAPGYARLILTNFGAMLGAAVEEGLIAQNPAGPRSSGCRVAAAKRPAVDGRPSAGGGRGVPMRYRALIVVAAGCGLRQGEAFGLRVQDVDFLRRELHVRQQIRLEATAAHARAAQVRPHPNGADA